MMFLFMLIGPLLYLGVLIDIIKTTLSMQGGGWLTSSVSHTIWNFAFSLARGNPKSRILDHIGYTLLVLIVIIWVVLLWLSFFVLLQSTPDSVVNTTTHIPATTWQKLYYAGFVLSTMGTGDFIASTNLWRMVSDVYAVSGLIFITMSITYFIPVLSAVIKQRELSIGLNSLGRTPFEILNNGWNGRNFNRFIKQTSKFSKSISKHSQNHRAYPVIHFFHNPEPNSSIILQLTKLYEALLILQNGVKKDNLPHPQEIAPLKDSLENYLEVVQDVSRLKVRNEIPPKIYRNSLNEGDFVEPSEVELSAENQKKRIVFLKLLKNAGWDWKIIYNKN